MILRAGAFTLAAAGADYCNSVQYLVNWGLVQGFGRATAALTKKTRGLPRVRSLCRRSSDYQLSFRLYLPLVAPVPPL
jgi:hypothetical protein